MASESQAIEKGELIVLMQDECHLIHGDTCGYTWIPRNKKITVPMSNFRKRQTYYGIVNVYAPEFRLFPYPKGNGTYTCDFLKEVLALYPEKRILLIWDGATYHKSKEVQEFLAHTNQGLTEQEWKLTCLFFAPNAPEQNPVEDIWLKGKNFIRRNFAQLTTFAKVKKAFRDYLDKQVFNFKILRSFNGILKYHK